MKHYYKKGDILIAYSDYQNNRKEVGIARLLEFISKGLPFSLGDDGKDLYNTEEWSVEWLDKKTFLRNKYSFRYPEKLSKILSDQDSILPISQIPDKFIETDGIEWY